MKRHVRGSMTVEAAVILPIFILVITFVLNFMNIFYMQLVVQQGLNNAGNTLSQYCYLVDMAVGMERLSMSDKVEEKAQNLASEVKNFNGKLIPLVDRFKSFKLSEIGTMVDNGKALLESGKALGTTIKSVSGDDLVQFALSYGVEAGGGMLVEAMVDSYLTDMKVNRTLLSGEITYSLLVGDTVGDNDLILAASYRYQNPLLSVFIDHIDMKQSVVVHPWVGGETEGLRSGKALWDGSS